MSDDKPPSDGPSTDPEPLDPDEVRSRSIFYERLPALDRDLVLIVAAVGDRGDPREGAYLSEIKSELARFYDDKRVSSADLQLALDDLVASDLLEKPAPNRYRATLKTGSSVDHYLERVGELWSDKIPEEDGAKTVIERRQVMDPGSVKGPNLD